MTYSPQLKEQKTTTTKKQKIKQQNKTKQKKKREARLLFYDYSCWLLSITLMLKKKHLPQHLAKDGIQFFNPIVLCRIFCCSDYIHAWLLDIFWNSIWIFTTVGIQIF